MNTIEEIKRHVDIVQLVSEYADVDTSSRIPKTLCPFHNENTPSFVMYPDTGHWHCFGACATGGDIFSFIMKKENLQFKEALRRLAEKAGINPHIDYPKKSTRTETTSLATLNEEAARWFGMLLNSGVGEKARHYLEGRGISEDIAKRYGIGYASGGMLTLASHLKSHNYKPQTVLESRLIVKDKNDKWRDFFTDRITFQIKDINNRSIGFGARSLDGSEPKYINTPHTSLFDKSSVLYGIDRAANTIRTSMQSIVVEGYMDVITAHEYGFKNVVASMGTAITAKQIQLLTSLIGNNTEKGVIILCLDSDAAGREGTTRALEEAYNALIWDKSKVEFRVASLIGNKDPDEAIREDPLKWQTAINEAVSFFDYLLSAYPKRFDISTGQGKARMVESMAPIILKEQNNYEQDSMMTRLAESIQVTEGQLKALMPTTTPSAIYKKRTSERIDTGQVANILDRSPELRLEDYLLALLLQYPETKEFGKTVSRELFTDTVNLAIFEQWKASEPWDEQPEVAAKAERLLQMKFPPSDERQNLQDVKQCIERLREREIRRSMKLHGQILEEAERKQDRGYIQTLRQVSVEQNERLKQIFIARQT